MSRPATELVEFDRLREIVRRYTTCAPGRRAVEQLAPACAVSTAGELPLGATAEQASATRTQLDYVFAHIREAIAYLRAGSELGFGALADPHDWLARLTVPGTVLAPAELLDAASLLDTAIGLKQVFRADAAKYPLLAARAGSLGDFRGLVAAIRRAVLPNGEISDDASAELKRIRATIGRTRDKIQKALRDLLRARGGEPGEDYVTLRNDRFVIPVRAAERRQVAGVVHGASATGQTLFVEPLEALELNNQLVQLAEDEAAEIHRILTELTARLAGERPALDHAAATIAEMDSLLARARFAREFGASLPEFAAASELRLDAARHPVLEDNLRRQGRSIVPVSLALGGDETMMVISGPNTGGKTVALKTVGLAILSAAAGIPVAAEHAVVPLADRVLVDIGDEQSIAADLSTFSAHALNLRAMLAAATERSLVLADEMGTGTAPEEGSALAVALLEEFRARSCLVLATTHHDRLKAYASTTPGVVNAAVEFDDVNLRPTYRLLVGVPGTSSGIAIAERLGLPPRVIERARALLAPEAREAAELIAYLHRSRDELEALQRQAREQLTALEEERRKLQTEWAERQRKRLAELERHFADTLKQYEKQIAALVGDIKDRELRARLEKQTPKRVAKLRSAAKDEADAAVVSHLADSQQDLGTAAPPVEKPPAPEEITAGARVRVRGLAQPVVVRQKDDRSAEVQAGPLRMKVRLDDIVALAPDEPDKRGVGAQHAAPARRAIEVTTQPAEESSSDEINVIGCTVEEAVRLVDKALDVAVLAGKNRLRIIHGHGTGALRKGLAEFLTGHPHVERFFAEDPEHGGTAITIVEFKG